MLGFLIAACLTIVVGVSLARSFVGNKPKRSRKRGHWTDRITNGNIFAVVTLAFTLPVLFFYHLLVTSVPMVPFSAPWPKYVADNFPIGSDEARLIADLKRRHFDGPHLVCRYVGTGVPNESVSRCDGPGKWAMYETRLVSLCGWSWYVSWTPDADGKIVRIVAGSRSAEY